MEERKGFGSNFGFLMAAVGSAVGLGNIWGSIVATVVLYVLPEALRQFSDYRMLVYAIVLILVMLFTWSPKVKEVWSVVSDKLAGIFKKKEAGSNE